MVTTLYDYQYYNALVDIEDDFLGFKKKAEQIAGEINDHQSHIPYAISVRGDWGSGKSSMLNFIESFLTDDCEVIRFNSWLVTNKEVMITTLFDEIKYLVNGISPDLEKKFLNYVKKVIPYGANALAGYLSSNVGQPEISNYVSSIIEDVTKSKQDEDKPLSIRKKELNDLMKTHFQGNTKKIVVIIDEIDRLFPDEIITIFQMIKAALDFPGIVFLVALDENVILESLSAKGIQRPAMYLEKVFNISFNINSSYQLRTLSQKFLIERLTETESDKVLKECVKAFFNLEHDYFVKEYKNPNGISLKDAIKNAESENKIKNLQDSYYELNKSFTEDALLDNPRRFHKLSKVLMKNWEGIYKEILNEDDKYKNRYQIQTVFLVMIASILSSKNLHPVLSEDFILRKMDKFYASDPFLKKVYYHLNLLTPILDSNDYSKSNSNVRYDITYKKSVIYISNYPDLLHLGSKEEDF